MWVLNNTFFWIFLFIIQIYFLSLISHRLFNSLYLFLHKIFKKDSIVVFIISIIFLPGTFIHEISHAVAATLLGSRVTKFSIWPKVEDGGIKMGYAQFVVLDVFRNSLIGISPLVTGIALSYLLIINFFAVGIYLKVLFLYLIFQVSNSMFLSKSDVKDLKILVPLVIISGATFYFIDSYFFKINLFEKFAFDTSLNSFLNFFYYLNIFFFAILLLNLAVLIVLKFLIKFNRY